jgi:A/G-specific adenine glycosylase
MEMRKNSMTKDHRNKVGDVRRTIPASQLRTFRNAVWNYWKKNGRHDLPWRKTRNPYRILVSEIMLQQTQVPRVIEKYKEFLKMFPTVQTLAEASLSDVLKTWSGLGYNRRAKYLHDAAKKILEIGNIKKALAGPLPGVGPYTRAAVRTFAYNEPHTMIETNIRTVFIHHFFNSHNLYDRRDYGNEGERVGDAELISLIEGAMEGQEPREWYWALMDYGAFLKQSGVRNNARSKGYTKQSKFKGSLREVRGAILRALTKEQSINDLRSRYKGRFGEALAGLERDGLIRKEDETWGIV